MTLTHYDKFALLPKRCDFCNRLFVFENYDVAYREVGIEHYSLPCVKCKFCCGSNQELKGAEE